MYLHKLFKRKKLNSKIGHCVASWRVQSFSLKKLTVEEQLTVWRSIKMFVKDCLFNVNCKAVKITLQLAWLIGLNSFLFVYFFSLNFCSCLIGLQSFFLDWSKWMFFSSCSLDRSLLGRGVTFRRNHRGQGVLSRKTHKTEQARENGK